MGIRFAFSFLFVSLGASAQYNTDIMNNSNIDAGKVEVGTTRLPNYQEQAAQEEDEQPPKDWNKFDSLGGSNYGSASYQSGSSGGSQGGTTSSGQSGSG
ncbi:MAG: hypothetical protein AB7F86_19165, partial [Bdellovibrionales bacterium]